MVKDADIIARSDAVLSLSMNTINAQLKMLLRRKVISNKWTMAWVNNTRTGEVSVDEKPGVLERVKLWKRIRKEFAEALERGDYHLLADIRRPLETDYTGAWNATIKGLYVEAVKDAQKEVILKVQFGRGTLIIGDRNSSGLIEVDMRGVVYAFKTPLSDFLVSVGKGEMLPDAEEKTKDLIRSKGLSSDHFTVEAIFMDIQRANVANFEKESSILPKEGPDIATAVTTVFNFILPSDELRKYILGYAVKRKNLKQIDEAIFQPTAALYSTSYVEKSLGETLHANKASSFNFHMMTQNRKPDPVARLPQPLLLHRVADAEVDGVYALRYRLFEEKVIDPLVRNTLQELVKGYACNGVFEPQEGREWRVEGTKFEWNHDNDLNIRSMDLKSPVKEIEQTISAVATIHDRDGHLELTFEVSFEYTVRYKAFRFLKLIDDTINAAIGIITFQGVKSIGQYATVLEARSTTAKGKKGKVQVLIKPGEFGKLTAVGPNVLQELDVELEKSYVSKYLFDIVNVGEAIISFNPIGWITNRIQQATKDARPADALDKKLRGEVEKALKICDEVDALNIVLPLGNVYTFKDLALANNDSSKILVARVGYAPIEEAEEEDDDDEA